MSIQQCRAFFRTLGREEDILEFDVSSATVELAAQAVGVAPARIAKTLSFLVDGKCVLLVCAGDAKVDNTKFKAHFHTNHRASSVITHQVKAAACRHTHQSCFSLCFFSQRRNSFVKSFCFFLHFIFQTKHRSNGFCILFHAFYHTQITVGRKIHYRRNFA